MSLSEARDEFHRAFNFEGSGWGQSPGPTLFNAVGAAIKHLPYGHPVRRAFQDVKFWFARITWKPDDPTDLSDFPFVDDEASRSLMEAVDAFLAALDVEIRNPTALAAVKSATPDFLGLIVDRDARTVRREGHHATATFLRSDVGWTLFLALLDAGADGIDRERLTDLHPDRDADATRAAVSRLNTSLASLTVRVSDGRKGKRRLESTDAT